MSLLLSLGLGAKLLGLGGTGILGVGARLLGWDRQLIAGAKKIPPKGWVAIGVALALIVGFFVHQHHAHAAIAAAKAEQKAADDIVLARQKAVDAAVLAQTVANYRAAADRARAEDKANADRVRGEQTSINERTDNDFEARIASARAAAERLSRGAATTNSSGGRGAAVPGIPSTGSVVAQIADQDRFSLADRLTATEQAIQLDELIKWVKSQAAVNPNKAK